MVVLISYKEMAETCEIQIFQGLYALRNFKEKRVSQYLFNYVKKCGQK